MKLKKFQKTIHAKKNHFICLFVDLLQIRVQRRFLYCTDDYFPYCNCLSTLTITINPYEKEQVRLLLFVYPFVLRVFRYVASFDFLLIFGAIGDKIKVAQLKSKRRKQKCPFLKRF